MKLDCKMVSKGCVVVEARCPLSKPVGVKSGKREQRIKVAHANKRDTTYIYAELTAFPIGCKRLAQGAGGSQ